MVKIKQMSGEEEDFNKEKLAKKIVEAGATKSQAEAIANVIEKQVVDNTSTYQIRETVVTDLKRINPDAAKKYAENVSGMR